MKRRKKPQDFLTSVFGHHYTFFHYQLAPFLALEMLILLSWVSKRCHHSVRCLEGNGFVGQQIHRAFSLRWKWTDYQVELFHKEEWTLSGSAVLHLLLDNPQWIPNDIDLYTKRSTIKDSLLIQEFVKNDKNSNFITDNTVELKKDPDVYGQEIHAILNYYPSSTPPSLQFLRADPSFTNLALVSRYDLDFLKNWYCGKTRSFHICHLSSLISRTSRFQRHFKTQLGSDAGSPEKSTQLGFVGRAYRSLERCQKYTRRGFTISNFQSQSRLLRPIPSNCNNGLSFCSSDGQTERVCYNGQTIAAFMRRIGDDDHFIFEI